MLQRILFIAWKELFQMRRDRLTMGMMIGIPLVQLLLFGYAINTDVRHLRTLVFDQDHSARSRDLVRRMEVTGYYDIVEHVRDYESIERRFLEGQASVAVVIPANFSSDLQSGHRTAQVQIIVDGSDPMTVSSAINTGSALLGAQSTQLLLARMEHASGGHALVPLEAAPQVWFNPEMRTAVFIVPGLIGVILTMTLVMMTSMAIARERERGTLEQLIASPIRSGELMVGKIIPYVVVGYIQMTIILLLGGLVFDVPIAGSLPLLYAIAVVFIAANLSVGLVFSTVARSQQQAMQMSFFFLLPNILLSGFMFPFDSMPRAAQHLAQLLPLTHFLRIVRGIVLKGSTFPSIAVELLWLSGILFVLLVIATLRFKKKTA